MLRPSYTDLLEIISKEQEDSFESGSRYTIVMAAAKRARELVDHAPILTEGGDYDKPVSTAVKELYEGKIRIGYADDKAIADEEDELDYESISVVSDDMFRTDYEAHKGEKDSEEDFGEELFGE